MSAAAKVAIFIETPLQLLCAYEVKSRAPEDHVDLWVRFTGRGSNDAQLLVMLDLLDLHYYKLKIPTEMVFLGCVLSSFKLSLILFKRYERVYVGSYFSGFLNLLKKLAFPRDIYFLDDGVATFWAAKEILEKKVAGSLFTFFQLSFDVKQRLGVEQHSFERLRERYVSDKKYNGSYFIGQPLLDKKQVSEEDYFNAIRAAMANANGGFYYISHRVESAELLERIRVELGVDVLRLSSSIEMFFLTGTFAPSQLHTCYSSALFSLAIMFPSCQIYSYKLQSLDFFTVPHYQDIEKAILSLPNAKYIEV